jgi:inhibitor of cysteine peptidase
MKPKVILPVLISILLLSLPACARVPTEVPLRATYDDFTANKNQTREITAQDGNTIKVTVASNPTTGFKWGVVNISSTDIIEQVGGSDYVPPETSIPGAGGQEVWTFKALKRGTGQISMAYSQPWQGGTKNAWTLDISVTVR